MSFHEHVDIYCERVGESFLAEPWNLFSNGFLVLAGVLIILRASRTIAPTMMKSYGALVVLVGVCSFSFHGWATQGTMMLDVLSIALCVFFIIGAYGYRVLGYSWWQLALVYAGLISSTVLVSKFLDFEVLNGSQSYLGIWLTMLVLGAFDLRSSGRWTMLQALGLFSLSLLIRTADAPEGALCEAFPLGVHYLWHALNAWVLYQVMKCFAKREPSAKSPQLHKEPSAH